MNIETFKQNGVEADHEAATRWGSWGNVTLRTEQETVHLTRDCVGADFSEEDIEALRVIAFDPSPEDRRLIHTGSDGSVFQVGKFAVKEQLGDGKSVLSTRGVLDDTIKTIDFPEDLQLFQCFMVIEPPTQVDEFGREEYVGDNVFPDRYTTVLQGGGDWDREAEIGSYMIMPYIDQGINLANLLGGHSEEKKPHIHQVFLQLKEKGVITGESFDEMRESAQKYAEQKWNQEFEPALDQLNATLKEKGKPGLGDPFPRNIVIDSSVDPVQFHFIDL